jgi:hypothetical protein
MKKPKRALSTLSVCPTCQETLTGTLDELVMHYLSKHERQPTEGERYQFRSFKRKNFHPKHYTTGPDTHPREVSGGLPSLGKRR